LNEHFGDIMADWPHFVFMPEHVHLILCICRRSARWRPNGRINE
jgi:hypothetical protein